MDWLERMKSAMDHIETNFANNISYDDSSDCLLHYVSFSTNIPVYHRNHVI